MMAEFDDDGVGGGTECIGPIVPVQVVGSPAPKEPRGPRKHREHGQRSKNPAVVISTMFIVELLKTPNADIVLAIEKLQNKRSWKGITENALDVLAGLRGALVQREAKEKRR